MIMTESSDMFVHEDNFHITVWLKLESLSLRLSFLFWPDFWTWTRIQLHENSSDTTQIVSTLQPLMFF